jgi:hypothetical protein
LLAVKDVLDPLIAQGAPKFTDYLQQFSDASKPIDAMTFMQNYLTGPGKITDVQGNLQLNKVQSMLDKITDDRGAPGLNQAKSLAPEDIDAVIAIRNELAANAYKDALAKTKGSDTTQLANRSGVLGTGPLGTAVKGVAHAATHAGLFATTGGVGNLLYQYAVKPSAEHLMDVRATGKLKALKDRLSSTTPTPGDQ